MAKRTRDRVLFPDQLSKPVAVQFDTEAMTSDGGVVLLGVLDRGLGLTKVALSALTDARDPARIVHSQLDMLRQRIYGLVLGYEDCNDSVRIAHDPAVKLAVGRGLDEADLASTATLCRFENAVSPRELVNAAGELMRWRLATLKKRFKKARVVTIDVERRIVAKAEVTETFGREPHLNLRFVVSKGMARFKPKGLYKVYRERGDMENRIKELKQLEFDRTSCHRFCANTLRVLLATVAYMLVQELRWRLRRTSLRRTQAATLRVRLFKMAARVEESVRRFVLHCPVDFPWAREWYQAALAVGAVPR